MLAGDNRYPITVVTGFLGSGKTTLLSNVLKEQKYENTAVLINEYGQAGLDHRLIRRIEEKTRLLNGGCICCNMRDDLILELKNLLNETEQGQFVMERVVIETTGLADPAPILFSILMDPILTNRFYVDSVVCCLDAVNASLHLSSHPEAVKQVISADTVLITKTDLITSEELDVVHKELAGLNPACRVYDIAHGIIDGDLVFTSGLTAFDPRRVGGASASASARDSNSDSDSNSASGSASSSGSFDDGTGASVRIRAKGRSNMMGSGVAGNDAVGDNVSHPSAIYSMSILFYEPLDWTAFGLWMSMLLYTHGEKVMRIKGMIDVGEQGPIVINGVQHIIHPPHHLPDWNGEEQNSQIVFIMKEITPEQILESLKAFQRLLGAAPKITEQTTNMGG